MIAVAFITRGVHRIAALTSIHKLWALAVALPSSLLTALQQRIKSACTLNGTVGSPQKYQKVVIMYAE
ncbi:hypothetical protein FRC12_024684 [Ceratobasidium sp. 428]|nr:hypothetical protein FRC12_024684 [Ceratobasidium sp. 428]